MLPNLLLWALLSDPSPAPTLLKKGLLELQHGDVALAQKDLEQASTNDPANPYIWSALAEVYARAHQEKLASAAATKAEQDGAGNPVVAHALALYYSRAGDLANAARLEEQYAASPKADSQAIGRAATWYLASGNDTKAVVLARKLASDPVQTYQLAQLFLRGQQFADAAELLGDGLRLHPEDPQLVLALGVARYGERRFEEAISTFLTVIRLAPDVPQSYLFLSRMLDQAGSHLNEITAVTRKWADRNPDNPSALLALAKAIAVQDAASAEVEPLLRRSIALDGNSWDAHYQLGLRLEQSHRYAEAAEELNRAISLNQTEAMPHYHLARVYDRLGKPQEAATERSIHQQLVNGKNR